MAWYEACTDRSGHTFWCAVCCKNIYCKLVQTGLAILFGAPSIAKIHVSYTFAVAINNIYCNCKSVTHMYKTAKINDIVDQKYVL